MSPPLRLLLQETLLTSGRSLPEATRAALSTMKLGGQGARIRKELLGATAPPPTPVPMVT